MARSGAGQTGEEPVVVAWQVGGWTDRHRSRAGFHAAVIGLEPDPIVLVEDDIALPPTGWELRASGLWADHVCETAHEHWSYGLEAFALAVDDPIELLGRGHGQRVAVGWELDFEASAQPAALGAAAYAQPGTVHGLVLVGDRTVTFEGPAVRSRRWGSLPDPDPGALDDALGRFGLDDGGPVGIEVALPTPDGVWWVGATAGGVRTRTDAGTE